MQDTLQMNMGVSKLEGPAMVMRVLGPDLNHNREAIMYCVNYLRKELLNSPKLELHKDASIYQHNYANLKKVIKKSSYYSRKIFFIAYVLTIQEFHLLNK